MKRTIICGISMKENVDISVYTSDDQSLPVSDRPVRYPCSAFLEKALRDGDELKVLLLEKKDSHGYSALNTERFKTELAELSAGTAVKIKYSVIDTDFSQARGVHEQLMGKIVDELEDGAHILADITYGPKDLPIVVFSALQFAEKFLNCKVDNIIYGQASFVNGRAVDTKICDMAPLYCLSAVTSLIRCDRPDRARLMLKSLLSL